MSDIPTPTEEEAQEFFNEDVFKNARAIAKYMQRLHKKAASGDTAAGSLAKAMGKKAADQRQANSWWHNHAVLGGCLACIFGAVAYDEDGELGDQFLSLAGEHGLGIEPTRRGSLRVRLEKMLDGLGIVDDTHLYN